MQSGDEKKPKVKGISGEKKGLELKIKEKTTGKTGMELNQTDVTENEAIPLDTKVDKAAAVESSQAPKEMAPDADEQGAKEKKSMLGKIIEKLPGYYKE